VIRTTSRAALLLLAVIVATLTATPAHAQPVKPKDRHGVIEMTVRTCGNASTWPAQAAANGITAANDYLVLRGRTYDIDCTRSATTARPPQQQASRSAVRAPSSKVDTVLRYAKAQLGDRYVWAQDGPNSFDCSGLVLAAYRQVGIQLPHQTRSMLAHGRKIAKADLIPGDVVWLQPQRGTKGHVGLYLGGDQVVEASSSKRAVVIRALGNRYWTARRLL